VSACPILVDDMIVQNCDADLDGFITALDKRTGKEIWRTDRLPKSDAAAAGKQDPDDADDVPSAATGGKLSNRGWSTPIVTTLGGRREIVLNGHEGVRAYDPATGKELWFCSSARGRGEATVTPVGEWLCVINGQGGEFYAVKPGGSGDVSNTHRQWHQPRKGRDTPSPIVIGNFILVNDLAGFLSCYNGTTGELYYKERVLSPASGSPIAANGLAYFLNEAGKTFVIEPAETLKIVAENELTVADDEIFRASITPCNGQLFIRSTKVLYCVGKK
jgi:outer membrane protein assembly factor BamB